MHMLSHFEQYICLFSAAICFSTDGTEILHKILKEGYHHSNRVHADAQILHSNTRIESFKYNELNRADNLVDAEDDSEPPQRVRRLKYPRAMHTVTLVRDLVNLLNIDSELFFTLLASAIEKWWHEDRFRLDGDEMESLEDAKVSVYMSMDMPRPIFNSVDDESMHSVRCTMDQP